MLREAQSALTKATVAANEQNADLRHGREQKETRTTSLLGARRTTRGLSATKERRMAGDAHVTVCARNVGSRFWFWADVSATKADLARGAA